MAERCRRRPLAPSRKQFREDMAVKNGGITLRTETDQQFALHGKFRSDASASEIVLP